MKKHKHVGNYWVIIINERVETREKTGWCDLAALSVISFLAGMLGLKIFEMIF